MIINCLLLFLLMLLDVTVIQWLRCFLWDFLMIRRNREGMKRNLMKQSPKDRITLSYIEPLLKKYQKPFRVWHRIYLCLIYSLIPQYVLLLIVGIVLGKWFVYVVVPLCLVKMTVGLLVRHNMDANLVSKYSKYSVKKT